MKDCLKCMELNHFKLLETEEDSSQIKSFVENETNCKKNVTVSKLSFISLTQIAHDKTSLTSYKEDSESKELN